jgi:hypothetical protein
MTTNLAESLPVLPGTTLRVEPWPDPVVDAVGHPLRGDYTELFWVGILGPTTTWIVRRFDLALTREPEGTDLDLATLAGSLGLTFEPGLAGPFGRGIHRCVMFGMAHPIGHRLMVRRTAPPLTQRQLARLPAPVRSLHDDFVRRHTTNAGASHR